MDAEALSDLLVESGALSACVEDADYGTEEESPIFDEPGEQVWRAMRAQVKLWKRCKVTALFLAGWDVPGVMEMVKESFELEETPKYQLGGVEEKDWVSEVQKNWPPILVGSLLLKFPWHSREELDQIRRDKGMDEKDPELMLEGGMAFGTGEHATTQLCCSWLQKKVHSGMRVLDYGAGSGILGMASLLYGAKEAVGVDIDRDSLLAAASNAKANDLFSSFKCYVPSEEADSVEDNKSPLIPGLGRPGFRIDPSAEDQDVSRIPASAKDFELTVANILAKPLIKLCPEIARLTAPGGLLGLSGVLEEQAGGVMEAYGEYFDDMKVDGVQNGWCLITGVRKA